MTGTKAKAETAVHNLMHHDSSEGMTGDNRSTMPTHATGSEDVAPAPATGETVTRHRQNTMPYTNDDRGLVSPAHAAHHLPTTDGMAPTAPGHHTMPYTSDDRKLVAPPAHAAHHLPTADGVSGGHTLQYTSDDRGLVK